MTTAPNYTPLVYWVKEREAIRIRKEERENALHEYHRKRREFGHLVNLPEPVWQEPLTKDSILAKFRFCNVRREDDRVTMWIRKNIREPFAGHQYLWLMLCIARQINWPGTLSDLINADDNGPYHDAWPSKPDFSPTGLASAMNDRQSMGFKLYTGAYMISAPSEKGANKQDYIGKVVIGKLWESRERFNDYFAREGSFAATVRETHERLSTFNGWGPFMAYQACGDMLFTHYLENAADKEQWCAAGPGTIRGLNRIHGRKTDFKLSQADARAEIKATWKVIRNVTGVDMAFNDVPNCYCETDKYLRVKNNEGTPRALYVPGRGS